MSHNIRALAAAELLRFEDSLLNLRTTPFQIGKMPDDARDARQLHEYVNTVIRQRRYYDFVISSFVNRPIDRVDRRLIQVLRIGICDLVHLSTADHAAVSEAVKVAKDFSGQRAGGFVNGVLRSVQRALPALPEPDCDSVHETLAIKHSHPDWMVERWVDRFGVEATTNLLIWNNQRPKYALRANLLRSSRSDLVQKLSELGIGASESSLLPEFVKVGQLQPVIRSGLLEEGICSVQDESAGAVVQALDPQPGESIVDLCAAPGGKTGFIAERMLGEGTVIAVDVDQDRVSLVAGNASRLGLQNIRCIHGDALGFVIPDGDRADRVLVDAPCSGLGVLSKRSDLRWRRTPDQFARAVALQKKLLAHAATLVKPGGVLVYSTCSIEPEENEEVASIIPEGFRLEQISGLPTEGPFCVTLPHLQDMDGAFAARYRRI